MKDKNGIEIKCENCDAEAQRDCCLWNEERDKEGSDGCQEYFYPSYKAYEARIAELQEHNDILQRRVQELSMELLDYNMKENKDVLERLKNFKRG